MKPLLTEIRKAPLLWLLAETPRPMGLALATLAGVTVLVALVSEIVVASVQGAVWFVGTPLLMVYAVFAMTLHQLPPRVA